MTQRLNIRQLINLLLRVDRISLMLGVTILRLRLSTTLVSRRPAMKGPHRARGTYLAKIA